MDLEYLSRVLMRLKPFVRDGILPRTRLERVLGSLQMPPESVRPEIERLLAKAKIRIEEDRPPAEPTEPALTPEDLVPTPSAPETTTDEPNDEAHEFDDLAAERAVTAARNLIARDRRAVNPSKWILTAEQEVGLSLLVRGDERQKINAGGFALLTGERKEAAHCFFTHNQGLVHSIAQHFPQTGMAYEDLVQHGYFGLIRAVEMFDPAKGYKFSTYATWWIRQSISRGVDNEARLIRLPVHMNERVRKVWKKRSLLTTLAGPPSLVELAHACELSEVAVMECLRLGPPDLPSLDMRVGDGESTLADLLDWSNPESSPEHIVELGLLRDEISAVLDTLSEREAGVISMRFGLGDSEAMTLDQIGGVYNVTRERIRQIEKKTMDKLRHPSRSAELRPYLIQSGARVEDLKPSEVADADLLTYDVTPISGLANLAESSTAEVVDTAEKAGSAIRWL